MVSKAVIAIVAAVVTVGGVFGVSAVYNNSRQAAIIPGAPSQQEIEAQIPQASSKPEYDRLWNEILDGCMKRYQREVGNYFYESGCNGRAITRERDSDCESYGGKLLICNKNSALGKKLQSYLNVIGYTERS